MEHVNSYVFYMLNNFSRQLINSLLYLLVMLYSCKQLTEMYLQFFLKGGFFSPMPFFFLVPATAIRGEQQISNQHI